MAPRLLSLLLTLPLLLLGGPLSATAEAGGAGAGLWVVVSDTGDAGPGTLRQAILDTNATGAVLPHVIQVTVTGTITLQTALPTANIPIALRGPGADKLTVERAGGATQFRLLSLNGNNSLVEGFTFKNGDAAFGSGGAFFLGGNNITIRGCAFEGNRAPDGAAIQTGGSGISILECTFTGNTASNDGGAISTFSGANIVDCTFSGNSATNDGGAISIGANGVRIEHCTITGNSGRNGGGVNLGTTTLTTILNTIVSGNTATGTGPDINGTLGSVTFTLVQDAAGSAIANGVNNNVVGDPALGALQLNGGTTKTHAITSASPAHDAGSGTVSPLRGGVFVISEFCFDQRGVGFGRRYGAAPDMGAFEVQTGTTYTVSNTSDAGAGSLRAAIASANGSAGIDVIDMKGVSGIVTLLTALPQITDGVILLGPGASKLTLQRGAAAANFSVLDMNIANSSPVRVSGLTISSGNAPAGGGINFGDPGARGNQPCLVIDSCAIVGNTATTGGGIEHALGALLVRNSTISGNTSTGNGGGINFLDPSTNDAIRIENSTISGNTAGGAGGGIFLRGFNHQIRFTTIANNMATGFGGGLRTAISTNDTIEIANSILAGNTSGAGGNDWSVITEQSFARNNVVEDAAGAHNNVNGVNGAVVGASPALGALANNGGETKTHLIAASSPAAGAALVLPGVTKDQRGFTRPSAAQDIGAFEDGGTAPTAKPAPATGG
ncbi:MAG: hypothetical protein JKY65_23240, partial [Planctomycetes bacterium]|nr:hypothetical protein [Planctomycetota bacterium]